MNRIMYLTLSYVQEKRDLFAARRAERQKFEERRAAKGQVKEPGKEHDRKGDVGEDAAAEHDLDVSDEEWKAEEAYMKEAEAAWELEERHPQNRAVLHQDVDPMWFSQPVHTFTRSTDGPASAKFVHDINRRRVRTSPVQVSPSRYVAATLD